MVLDSLQRGLLPSALAVLVIVINFLFYSWSGTNAFYLGLEFLFFFLILVSSFWRTENKKSKAIALILFLLLFGLDLLFALTIVFREGFSDKLNLFLAILDGLGILTSLYWFLNQL